VRDLTRREFLEKSLKTGSAFSVAASGFSSQRSAVGETVLPSTDGASEVAITLRINGKDHQLRLDPRTTLLDCIRETVALTGTKKGCDHANAAHARCM
jgi:xanthine dehydrogenase YagT iron-sulfur-binding subunit